MLDTSINNVGGVVHPAAMLLNSYATERAAAGEALVYYQDQVNPTVANLVMEPLDAERVAVGKALGLRHVLTFGEWSARASGTPPARSARPSHRTRPTPASARRTTCSRSASSTTRCRTRWCRSSSSAGSSACRRR